MGATSHLFRPPSHSAWSRSSLYKLPAVRLRYRPRHVGCAMVINSPRNRLMAGSARACAREANRGSTKPGMALAVFGNFLDQLDNRAAQTIVIDACECLQQPIGMRFCELVKDRLLVDVPHLVAALEQRRDWNAEEDGNLQQSAAADAIGPLL